MIQRKEKNETTISAKNNQIVFKSIEKHFINRDAAFTFHNLVIAATKVTNKLLCFCFNKRLSTVVHQILCLILTWWRKRTYDANMRYEIHRFFDIYAAVQNSENEASYHLRLSCLKFRFSF